METAIDACILVAFTTLSHLVSATCAHRLSSCRRCGTQGRYRGRKSPRDQCMFFARRGRERSGSLLRPRLQSSDDFEEPVCKKFRCQFDVREGRAAAAQSQTHSPLGAAFQGQCELTAKVRPSGFPSLSSIQQVAIPGASRFLTSASPLRSSGVLCPLVAHKITPTLRP
jgi:hypothetical protein